MYRKNRDERMLPTVDAHFAQIGRELAGDVMKRRQVCNTQILKLM